MRHPNISKLCYLLLHQYHNWVMKPSFREGDLAPQDFLKMSVPKSLFFLLLSNIIDGRND